MPKMSIFFIAFISIFYIVGFVILGSGLNSLNQANAAKHWPTTSGIMEDVQFITDNDSDGTTYEVRAKYLYRVQGVSYEGDNISFGYNAGSGLVAHQQIYEKLKSAKKIEVRFNPDQPSQSTLAYGATRSHFIMLTFGATWLLFVIGFTILVFMFGQTDAGLLSRLIVLE